MEPLQDIYHVPEFYRLQIQHFFEVYKALEPGKLVQAETWADRAAAEAEIEACRKRAAEAAIDHSDLLQCSFSSRTDTSSAIPGVTAPADRGRKQET
jgi:hypothetical protein